MTGEHVLALDSCGAETTLCLGVFCGAHLEITRDAVLPPRTAGARLTGALREILGELPPSGLRAMVVVRGPGSFTGMRVGLSAAKALSEAAGVPLVALSRLAVLASTMPEAHAVILHAGRGSVYVRMLATGEETLLTAEEACNRLGDGSGMAVCEDKTATAFPAARQLRPPTAADALRYAWDRVIACDWDDSERLDALYLWQADEMLRTPSA